MDNFLKLGKPVKTMESEDDEYSPGKTPKKKNDERRTTLNVDLDYLKGISVQ